MKTLWQTTATLCALLIANIVQASHGCKDPVADWQPRDALRQQLEDKGWEVRRIKVDDGCYEAKGFDRHGNKVEADYMPSSLRLRELEIKFKEDAVIPDGLYSGGIDNANTEKDTEKRQRRTRHESVTGKGHK
ncbi:MULTISPECIES: PepSY domain-containing protein [Halomonas]|uniref:PepSY domain-containing protein n=1 Tax=Halomonas TaxID=2745 RepID=UPI00289E1823|nr:MULTISPECIES: PepSY domain-containing protein [Halomonas]